MRSRVKLALDKIKENGGVAVLYECPVEARCEKLAELLPEIKDWDIPIARQQLYYSVQYLLGINLNACEYFRVDDHRQYCFFRGIKEECCCLIPQTSCVIRDQRA